MELKRILRLYKNLIIVGAFILLSLIGFLFGVVPLAQKTLTLWSKVRALSSEVTLLTAKSGLLQSLDREKLKNDVLTLSSAVPGDKSLATILTTIDTVSGQSSVAISSVALAKPGSIATESAKKLTKNEAKLGTSLLPFSVGGRASFEEIKTFLTNVVAVRRMFRIRTFDLTNTGGLTSIRVDLDAFYLPFPENVGAATKPITDLTEAEEQTIAKVQALPLASATLESTVSGTVPGGKEDPFAP